ncbi:MAG: hypothetical protein JW953_02415 [Anaerolineae bacterium]|nr:hypothetical protein [Anaerolineae bacterium]
MRRYFFFWHFILIALILPGVACGFMAGRPATPTPTKTPKLVELAPQTPLPTPTAVLLPTPASTVEVAPGDAAAPPPPDLPPTDTPLSPPPTDTPPPPPPPTDTPPPPPPPTDTPAPPPPTNTPAPPPPTQPPANQPPQVVIELPNGNTFDPGDEVKIVFIVRDTDGVSSFSWGIFTQNQVSLKGGEKTCNGATECKLEVKEVAPGTGTYIVGADAADTTGATTRGVGEIYVR